MFQKALKIWFWRCFDPLGRLIILNSCWVLAVIGLILVLRIVMAYSRTIFVLSCITFVAFLLPLLLIVLFKLVQIINEEGVQSNQPFKPFLQSRVWGCLPLYWLDLGAFLLLASNIYFYAGIYTKHPWAGGILVGLFFWLTMMWMVLQAYIIPLFLEGKRNLPTILKHAAILTLDNPTYTLLNMFMSLFIIVVSVCTVLGLFLLMMSVLAVWQNTACLVLLEKYRQQAPLTEQRGWRQLFKPWEI